MVKLSNVQFVGLSTQLQLLKANHVITKMIAYERHFCFGQLHASLNRYLLARVDTVYLQRVNNNFPVALIQNVQPSEIQFILVAQFICRYNWRESICNV
ncbi:hypothetical protein D3C85_1280610 [compost metagenome]